MNFHMEANFTFEAKNLDDALLRIGLHFLALSNGEESTFVLSSGSIEVQPIAGTKAKT